MDNNKPNLIYIFADQLRYFSLGYAGDENALTPDESESSYICSCSE